MANYGTGGPSWNRNYVFGAPMGTNPYEANPANYLQPTLPQQNNGIVWVQGEAGAKAYPVAAGNTVMLMDSESNRFFLKTTDLNGMPQPLRVFDYAESTQLIQSAPKVEQPIDVKTSDKDYVTKEEFEELKQLLEDLTSPKKG